MNQSSDRNNGYCPSTGNIHRCPGSKDEPLLLNFLCCSRARAQSQPSPTDEVDRLACAILSFVFYPHLRGTRNNGCGPPRVKMTSTWLEINLLADEQRCTALLRRFNCASESRCWQGPRYDSAGTPYRQSRVNARMRALASAPPIGRSLHFVCISPSHHPILAQTRQTILD